MIATRSVAAARAVAGAASTTPAMARVPLSLSPSIALGLTATARMRLLHSSPLAAAAASAPQPRQPSDAKTQADSWPASEPVAQALHNAKQSTFAGPKPLATVAQSFLNRLLVEPSMHFISGLGMLYSGSAHTLHMWMNVQEKGLVKERHEIRHVLRNKLDLQMILPGAAYMCLPFQKATLPLVFSYVPALLPTVFYTDTLLFAKVAAAKNRHPKLAAAARQKAIEFLKAIPADTLRASPVAGADRRRAALVQMLENPETVKEADLVETFAFCATHFNAANAPLSLLVNLGYMLHLSLPMVAPRGRLHQWGDWMIKDNQLIRQDAVRSLSEYELFEALLERGYLPSEDMTVPQLQTALTNHLNFSHRVVDAAIRNRMRINTLARQANLAQSRGMPGAAAATTPAAAAASKASDVLLTPQDIGGIAMVLAMSRVILQ
ncbi:hypothetical protein BC831DRAFT_486970 [Entophlyctis helioformis]|nr:hypothetical protein BC831DRAFT_486970 [Entophlyctis helioformis]